MASSPKSQAKSKTIEKLATNQPFEVPLLVLETAKFIHQHGLTKEGIFRRSPETKTFTEVKRKYTESFSVSLFLSGFARPAFSSLTDDPHVAAHILKDFLRNLDAPLFPPTLNVQLISCVKADNRADKLQLYRACLSFLPLSHLKTLILLGSLCNEIVEHANANKMSFQALGVVMGPCLIRLGKTEMIEMWDSRIMEEMLTNFEAIIQTNPHALFPTQAWLYEHNNSSTVSLALIGEELTAGKLELFCSCVHRRAVTQADLGLGKKFIGGEYEDTVTLQDGTSGTMRLSYLLDLPENLPPFGLGGASASPRMSPRGSPRASPRGSPRGSPKGSPLGSPGGSGHAKMKRSISPLRLPRAKSPNRNNRKDKKDIFKQDPATISKSNSDVQCSLPALSIDSRGIRRGKCLSCDCPMYQFRPRRVICQYCEHSNASHSSDTKKCTKCDCEMFEKEVYQGPLHRCGSCSHPPTKHENLAKVGESGLKTEDDPPPPRPPSSPSKHPLSSSSNQLEMRSVNLSKNRPTPELHTFLSSPNLFQESASSDSSQNAEGPLSPTGPPRPARPSRRNESGSSILPRTTTEPAPNVSSRTAPPLPLPRPPRNKTPPSSPPVPPRSPHQRNFPPPQPFPSESRECSRPTSGADPLTALSRSNVVLLCFSILSRNTLFALRDKWIPSLAALFQDNGPPMILVGMFKEARETEEDRVEVLEAEGKEMAEKLGCFGYVELSSVRYQGFRMLAELCLDAVGFKKKGSFPLPRPMSPRKKKEAEQGCILM